MFDVVFDHTGSTVRALANLVAIEVFELRAKRSVDVVILASEPVLPLIA